MIATTFKPRNQVIDWNSRELNLQNCRGFFFPPRALTPCISPLPAVAIFPATWQQKIHASSPSLQPMYKEKKKKKKSHGTA